MSSSGSLSTNDDAYQQTAPCTDGYSLLLHTSHLTHSTHLHNSCATSSNNDQAEDDGGCRKNDHGKSKAKLTIPTLKFTLESRCNSKCDVTEKDGKENEEINNNDLGQMYKKKEHSKICSRNSDCSSGGDKVRQQWDNKLQFVLSLISYAVGLGNIWRFPYLCQKYGGGAFLIPYTISLIFLGIPLFYLELGIGQKLRTGSIGVWNKIHPLLGGVGISSAIVSFLLGLYYNVIIAWCIFYMINSFQFQLPWEHCPLSRNGTSSRECRISSATSYFWYHEAIKVSSDLTDFGSENSANFNWAMAFCLIVAWAVVFLSLMKGIKSSGKVGIVSFL
uniref:Transporter n=1 Tax=Romanomermis culicivorax TaxID=13658 RepID=A0A915KPG3_ROMCU